MNDHRTAQCLLAMCLSFAGKDAVAQWTQIPAWPFQTRLLTLVHDEDRGRMVALTHPQGGWLLETWEHDGSAWAQTGATTTPGDGDGFRGYAMVYDTLRRRVLLVLASESNLGRVAVRSYDGTRWTDVAVAGAPPGGRECAAAFDEARGRLLVYNGTLYEWDGATWYQQPTSPPRRTGTALAYDKLRRVALLDGGLISTAPYRYDSTAWEWDGVQWRTAGPGIGRDSHGMAYDHARRTVVAFGGQWTSSDGNLRVLLADPRAFRNGAWVALPTGPTHAMNPVLAHDIARGRLVVAAPATGWAYELGLAGAATYAALGPGCAGSTVLALSGGKLAWIGSSFEQNLLHARGTATAAALLVGDSRTAWGNLILPLDLTPVGMRGCTLFTSVELVVPFALAGGGGVVSLPIPSQPWLLGVQLFAQCAVPDPTANSLGLVLTNARSLVIGT